MRWRRSIPTVGDLAGNSALIADSIRAAREAGAGLVVTPELCLPGYPAEDLYLKRHFAEANARAVAELAERAQGITALVGFAEPRTGAAEDERRRDGPARRAVHNSLAVLRDGRVEAVYRKNRLPNYGVFDEVRYFEPGSEPVTIDVDGVRRRADDLRGPVGAGAARLARGRGRGPADRQPVRLAVPARQGRRPRPDARPTGRAPTASRSPSATWSAARTS